MSEQNPDSDLTQELLSLKNSRTVFVGHLTRLICKIETCICNSDKVEKIFCLREQLAVILETLKAINNKFISLNENLEDIESANKIYFAQNYRVLNTNEIIENYISRKHLFTESLSSKSILSSKSRVNSNSSQSQSNTLSSSSVSRKRVKAELLLKQSHERFKRKLKLLERQKSLELELERENLIEAENQLKLLKDDYNLDKENYLSDMERAFFAQVKQRTIKLKVI